MRGTDTLVVDSVTQLDARARAKVVVCGSHAGVFSGRFAARRCVRAIILHDAGVGKDEAGIAGLAVLEQAGVPAAAIASVSAAIGDGRDTLAHGVVSHVNASAAALGCRPGQHAEDAAGALSRAAAGRVHTPPPLEESRHLLRDGDVAVWALDSVSDAKFVADDAVLFTGSHANLLGGRAETALRGAARLVVYNDAGATGGRGLTRLPVLDRRAIPAGAVSAQTARIGDGRSTYHDGVVSAVNDTARALGARPGVPARSLLDLLAVPA